AARDADLRTGGLAHRRAGLLAAPGEARTVADHLHRDVADAEAGLTHPARRLVQQTRARSPRPLGPIHAEVRAEVADPGRGEERIAGRMAGDVGIGVAGEPGLTLPEQPGDPQLATGLRRGEGVHVHPDAHAGER